MSIFQKSISVHELTLAWLKVKANQGAAGGDQVSIGQFNNIAGYEIERLHNLLTTQSYFPSEYRMIEIPKTNGGLRPLAIPSIIDRIAQTSLATQLTQIVDPLFDDDSYGYRKGKSVQQAIARIDALRRQGYRWSVEADIVRCFERIPHGPLLERVEMMLKGQAGAKEVTDLIELWLEHAAICLGEIGRGLPQGSPLSPLLANIYLDQLDEAFEDDTVHLVRFADDFVILCKSEKNAKLVLGKLDKLLDSLGLEIRQQGTQIVPFDEELEFLGHIILRSISLRSEREDSKSPVENTPASTADTSTNIERARGYEAGERVLYVVDKDRRISLINDSFAVENLSGRVLLAIPHHRIDRIVLSSAVEFNSEFIHHCLATQTEIYFENSHGLQGAKFVFDSDQRAKLYLAQAKITLDKDRRFGLAKKFVEARIRNQRARLQVLNRNRKNEQVILATSQLGGIIRKLTLAEQVDELYGFEGRATAIYWPALSSMCEIVKGKFIRTRPANDPLNATLNYLTAMLARDVRSAIERAGLYPGFGVLHTSDDRKEACVYDLMEPYRAVYAEGLAIMLFNRRHLVCEMFEGSKNNIINAKGRRAIIQGYESLMARIIKSQVSGNKMTARMLMREDARRLAAHFLNPDECLYKPTIQDY